MEREKQHVKQIQHLENLNVLTCDLKFTKEREQLKEEQEERD